MGFPFEEDTGETVRPLPQNGGDLCQGGFDLRPWRGLGTAQAPLGAVGTGRIEAGWKEPVDVAQGPTAHQG